ncbi:MAG: ABC transporter ATP-binding protein/permease, partial [Clostridium sp.]|nr:ABC transporter ATP-binding protein/permease [Clostridium sp.]
MKRIFKAYKDLISIIYHEAPICVIATFVCTIISGLLSPLGVYVNQNVIDGGIAVANGEIGFDNYVVYLVLFVLFAIVPQIITGFIDNYAGPRSLLILRTTYRERMLKKLKTMKYEHFENEETEEIIDKAYNRTETAARHLWPMYVFWRGSSLIASIGILWYILQIRWWMLLTVLIPFVIETIISSKNNYNIYTELETYWKKERKYGILGWKLRSREDFKELKSYGIFDTLINTYKTRLNERNRDYERYYFKNIKHKLLGENITKIASILNVIILLVLFVYGQMSVGLFISMSGILLSSLYSALGSVAGFFKWSGMHIKTYEYYDKFFDLSDDAQGSETVLPDTFDIEFRDVWFRYPGTDKDILKGLTFKIHNGEKASIVGENGEGKSTMVNLLLGLFTPDRGDILIGGKHLDSYPMHIRTKIFGSVFQDFTRYSITIRENIAVGDIEYIDDEERMKTAACKGKADEFAESYEKKYDTLLGRTFDDGIDLSGGQWQRIAIARAFMGDKPVLLLDEPTS